MSDVASGEISQPNDNPIRTTSIPKDGESHLFPWADVSPSFDFSQALFGSEEPSHVTSPPSIGLESNPSSQQSAGAFCVDDNNCPASGNSGGDTTSCTIAYQMVLQYNTKGLDMVEIFIRLWNGCRKGKDSRKDCTVDNKVLFDVLDYINS